MALTRSIIGDVQLPGSTQETGVSSHLVERPQGIFGNIPAPLDQFPDLNYPPSCGILKMSAQYVYLIDRRQPGEQYPSRTKSLPGKGSRRVRLRYVKDNQIQVGRGNPVVHISLQNLVVGPGISE